MDFNKKFRSLLAGFLVLVILGSSTFVHASPKTFKDVPKTRWSYDHIMKMADIGYLEGKGDGRFDPTGNLTFMESMALLSRFVEPTSREKGQALDKYESLMRQYNIKQNWEKEAISVALYFDIVSENEVKNTAQQNILHRPLQKVAASVFLARAMGLRDKANDMTVVSLNFKDTEKIQPSIRKYIKVLSDIGVIQGDDKGYFNPAEALRREIMAKMAAEGYEYVKKNPITRPGDESIVDDSKPDKDKDKDREEKTETIKGSFIEVTRELGKNFLVIENRDGKEKSYIVERDASIRIDGKRADLSDLERGQDLKLEVGLDSRGVKSIEAEHVEEAIKGALRYVSSSNREIEVDYKDGKKVKTENFDLDSDVKIELDGKSSSLRNLRKGDYVELEVRSGKVYRIKAQSEDLSIRGDIKKIGRSSSHSNKYIMEVKTSKDEVYEFLLDSDTKVYRDRANARPGDLRVEDDVYVDARYKVEEGMYLAGDVDAKIVTKKVEGYVLSITNRINENPIVTIKNKDTDKEEIYELTATSYIKVDDKVVSTLPSNPGYEVELYVSSGKEIVEAYADSETMENTIIGRIDEINFRHDYFDLEIQNLSNIGGERRYLKIYLESETVITNRHLDKLDIDDLSRDDVVSVIGIYKGASFVADTVILR